MPSDITGEPGKLMSPIGKNGAGGWHFLCTNADGQLITCAGVPTTSLALSLAAGNVTGCSSVHKFGEAQNIDADVDVDIWDGATLSTNLRTYAFSSSADIDRLSSSDDGDTQDIEVHGLNTDWDLVTQTITLTGQTPVALTTSLIRAFRLKNVGATDNAGVIYCFVNVATTAGVPNTITNTRAAIQVGLNQTLMAIYSVPRAVTGYMGQFYSVVSNRKDQISDIALFVRPFDGVFQLKHRGGVHATGTSYVPHQFRVPEKILAKSDIRIEANSSKADGAVAAGFDLILVDD